jgi:hypothetical protein
MPTAKARIPTRGLNTIVCGLEISILKKPTSATRSVVKYVILGTAKAIMPTTTIISPITVSGRIFSTITFRALFFLPSSCYHPLEIPARSCAQTETEHS